MAHASLWQLLAIFMASASCCNLMMSADLFKKYPYWADYLTDPHTSQLIRCLTSPICVWPGRFFENYTKLTVSNVMTRYE